MRPRIAMTLEQCWHRVPGGTAVAALGMAAGLAAGDGVDIVGVAARHNRPPPPEWRPVVGVTHLALPRIALYESWHRLRRPAVEAATGAVDAIHATTLAVPPRTAPLIVTIHDLAFLHDPSHFSKRGLAFFARGLALARGEADIVMCPSEATARDCEANGFELERIRVVPLGIDATPTTDADIERVRTRYSLRSPYILWTGTIEPRKNLSGLLAAWRLLDRDLDLVLAGPRGWNEDADRLVDEGMGRVKLLGFVPRPDLEALYGGAAAFCWPSLLEGFGLPVLEAMAQGAPVITSRGTSTEELAGDAGLVVDPRDPADIAGALTRVLEDDGLARRLSDAGRARAAEYTWARTATALTKIYSDVARVAA